jgi:hypothetical protein
MSSYGRHPHNILQQNEQTSNFRQAESEMTANYIAPYQSTAPAMQATQSVQSTPSMPSMQNIQQASFYQSQPISYPIAAYDSGQFVASKELLTSARSDLMDTTGTRHSIVLSLLHKVNPLQLFFSSRLLTAYSFVER